MLEKKRFTLTTLLRVSENVTKGEPPIDNPILLIGLDRSKRYEFFFRAFNKEFNSQNKGKVIYISCDKIDVERELSKKMIILENIELLVGNKELQDKMHELLNKSYKQDIQVILCASSDIKKLDIDEIVKSKMLCGLSIDLDD